jgi:hypothetical protein
LFISCATLCSHTAWRGTPAYNLMKRRSRLSRPLPACYIEFISVPNPGTKGRVVSDLKLVGTSFHRIICHNIFALLHLRLANLPLVEPLFFIGACLLPFTRQLVWASASESTVSMTSRVLVGRKTLPDGPQAEVSRRPPHCRIRRPLQNPEGQLGQESPIARCRPSHHQCTHRDDAGNRHMWRQRRGAFLPGRAAR